MIKISYVFALLLLMNLASCGPQEQFGRIEVSNIPDMPSKSGANFNLPNNSIEMGLIHDSRNGNSATTDIVSLGNFCSGDSHKISQRCNMADYDTENEFQDHAFTSIYKSSLITVTIPEAGYFYTNATLTNLNPEIKINILDLKSRTPKTRKRIKLTDLNFPGLDKSKVSFQTDRFFIKDDKLYGLVHPKTIVEVAKTGGGIRRTHTELNETHLIEINLGDFSNIQARIVTKFNYKNSHVIIHEGTLYGAKIDTDKSSIDLFKCPNLDCTKIETKVHKTHPTKNYRESLHSIKYEDNYLYLILSYVGEKYTDNYEVAKFTSSLENSYDIASTNPKSGEEQNLKNLDTQVF